MQVATHQIYNLMILMQWSSVLLWL